MTDVHTLLARNLKKYRQILGLSQAALAEKINSSTTFIGNIEIGKRFPSSKNLDLLVNALGVKAADLFAEEDEPEAQTRYVARQKRKAQLEREVLESISKAFSEGD
jgi:transcriptional regulator with XRE-family HTH domain